MYGETKGENSSETDPILPNNVLGITKAFAENLIVYANRKHALEYTILRPSNIYGINGEKFVIKTMLNLQQIKLPMVLLEMVIGGRHLSPLVKYGVNLLILEC